MALAIEVQWMGRDERGSVLVSAMMLVLIITLIGAGIFYAAVIDNRMMRNDLNQDQTFYTAEAGLNIGLRELADSTSVNNFNHVFTTGGSIALFTNQPFPLDANNNARASYTVTAAAVPNTTPKQMTVTATGCTPAITTGSCPSANTQTTVQAVLIFQDTLAGPFFALNTFSSGGVVDSYDSSQATCQQNPAQCYANTKCPKTTPPPLNCGADIHVNGLGALSTASTVTVSTLYGSIFDSQGRVSLGTVYGNATYDQVKGSCPTCDSTHVKGSIILTATSAVVIPPVQPCGPPYTTGSYTSSHGIPSSAYNASTGVFSLSGNNSSITITPGTFCFSSLSVSGKGVVNLASTQIAPVTIFVTGLTSLTSTSGSINNQTSRADLFQILSSYNSIGSVGVTISGHANGYMYVYAPQTQVAVQGQSDLYGAILGYDITASNGSDLHFDKALGNSGNLSGGIPNYTWASGTWKTCKNPTCT